MTEPLYLAIDLGTSSVRAALVDARGNITGFASRGFEQLLPRFAWSEQYSADWWSAAVGAIREAVSGVAPGTIDAICACGQMHGTVLLDEGGGLASDTALLWNDKRAAPHVRNWEARHPYPTYAPTTANPATPAWPAFKLQWLRDHRPEAYAAATTVLTPKDYINFRLTGARATDLTEASLSFLMDRQTGTWSADLAAKLGVRSDLLPPILSPLEVVGTVLPSVAEATGLRAGTPVLAGGGDLPVALIGSGACRPGIGSDIAGTSAIATIVGPAPVLDPIICNVAVPGGGWGRFTLVDAGGDAIRWAQRTLADIPVDERQEAADPLFFLPFQSGERMGKAQNARAQFFGITARHGPADLYRAVLEGVAMALRMQFDHVAEFTGWPEAFTTAGAGGRSELWLRIKAALYDRPILVPRSLEAGVIGCAVLAATASGGAPDIGSAAARMVSIEREVRSEPALVEHYASRMPVFQQIRESMGPLYDALDRLSEAQEQP